MNIPAALDVVEGMAGHTSTSAAARPIASPNEFDPQTVSKLFAMRSPNPVRSKPCGRVNAGGHAINGSAKSVWHYNYWQRKAQSNCVGLEGKL